MAANWQVGIDIGGTFTDVIARPLAGDKARSAKVATRPDDRVKGLLAALRAVSLEWADVADLVLGTTMITNAIVEAELAPVALISTLGFGDTLAIGRQNRAHLYRLDPPAKMPAQVPPGLRFEVAERLDHEGRVLQALDEASVEDVLARIRAANVQAVAVSLLHSYANPAHELALAERLRPIVAHVALSHQVNPEAREYERAATTVLSASLMPLAATQIDRMQAVRPAGARLHLFHSAGGMAAPSLLRELPLGLAMSGPAAGVAAAGHIARTLGIAQALSFDMGGTTTDVCLIAGGRAQVGNDRMLGGRPIRQPMVAVHSIGAGGGSVARLDHGALLVGPQSAGADPGPACYGRGGTRPTVSDANLVLGYLDASRVLGDGLKLDAGAARTAIKPLAAQMQVSIEDAALGIIRVANSAMVRALGRITVEQGIDGRGCVLLAFGGAGPMHAVDVAREFGISRVIVPDNSSIFSALGCVSADMSYTRQQTLRMASAAWDAARLERLRDELRASLVGRLQAPAEIAEVALIRYRGQSYAIEVPEPDFSDPGALGRAFQVLHNKLYGFATDEPWELQALRMTATVPRATEGAGGGEGAAGGGEGAPAPSGPTSETPHKTTLCSFAGGAIKTPRFDRAILPVGKAMPGPLVVEDAFSTVIVPPGATLTQDDGGNLVISCGVAP